MVKIYLKYYSVKILLKKAVLIGAVTFLMCLLENLLIFAYLWKVLSISPLVLLS